MKIIDISTPGCPNATLMVDDDDWDFVRRHKWTPRKNKHATYAVTYGKRRAYLHREIMRARFTEMVDHIDGNGLNNCKSNLRLCTNAQNVYNSVKRRGKSKYKGVFPLDGGRCFAHIAYQSKRYYLGRFETEEAGARAYDEAARRLHGEFARLNFPDLP